MTSTILTVGIPTPAVLVGIVLNRNDANQLRGELMAVSADIGSVRNEVGSVRSEVGSVRAEMHTENTATRKQLHDDVIMLMGVARPDTRVTRL